MYNYLYKAGDNPLNQELIIIETILLAGGDIMSNKKENSNRKILIVLLLLIFVGAGIFYYTINLDQGEFAEPMNEDELELLEDDVEDDIQDDMDDEIDNDIDDETTSSNGDELTDPEEETSQIDDHDTSDDGIDDESHVELDTEDTEDIEKRDQPDIDDVDQTDPKTQTTDDTNDLEGEELVDSDAIAEDQEKATEEDEGIIDKIISFLSTSFRSDDSEEIAVKDIDDADDIEDKYDLTEEILDQTDSILQLETTNLVVLGIDDLSETQEITFDFIGIISFDADNLEIEFKIIPSRYTYEDQELRELSQEELITVITELTDLQIDYELVLDYSGFQYYVDEINGIELELSDEFIIPDLDLDLARGNNKLNGTEALNYARFYNPDNGERNRINRQQEVIDKIYHKSLKLENLLRLPGHYNHLINEKEAADTNIDQEMIRNTIRYIRQLDQLSIKYSVFSD